MERKPFGNFENILMCFVSFFPCVKNSVAPLLYFFFFQSTFFFWYFINNKMTKNHGNIIEFNCVFLKRFLSVINKTCTGYLKNTWWTLYSTKAQDFQTPIQHFICTGRWKKHVVSIQINVLISNYYFFVNSNQMFVFIIDYRSK